MSGQFALPAGAALRVLTASGKITVTAEDRTDLEIEPPDRRIELKDGGHIVEVRSRSSSLHIRCPRLIDISVGSISGHVQLIGEFGSVSVSTVSGHIEVDTAAGDVDARSVSGHLSVKACRGRCRLTSKSGHVSIGLVEKAACVATLSGHVELGTAGREEVEIKAISGRVTVRVAEGRYPRIRFRSLSGRVNCECPQGSDFDLKASTVSGRLEVTSEALR